MRILVTGATGFAGGHLVEALLARAERPQVHGLSRHGTWPAAWQHLAGKIDLRACDAGDTPALEAVLRQTQPEQIYHLAGYAHVGKSIGEPAAAWYGNLTATLSLYEAVARWGGRPRILYVGSGQIYVDPEAPAESYDEDSPLRPVNPYAASKAAADLASFQWTRAPGLDVVRARPFNHVGPRQSPQFAVSHFAQQLADVERGRRPPLLETGNLSPRRDLTDVRDMVRAYVLLMERGRRGEAYNIGTGQTYSMQEVLDRLLARARAPGGARVEVRQRTELVRSTDAATVRADAGKLRRETGWAPAWTLDQTLTDMLAYWRHQEGTTG
jgi:GDP-4-dehydro-6-deoxy-D-mannose reductase